jgi:DNA-binding MarR family transcriptional regulator
VISVNDEALRAWAAFLRYHAWVTDVLQEELETEVGMPLTWYDVLVQLEAAPDHRLRMQELACAVVLSKSGLTRLVDRLERAGLVERMSCPSDRRGTFAEITPAGRKQLKAARPVHRRGIDEHFAAHLSERQTHEVGDLFEQLIAALRPPDREPDRADTSAASPLPSS